MKTRRKSSALLAANMEAEAQRKNERNEFLLVTPPVEDEETQDCRLENSNLEDPLMILGLSGPINVTPHKSILKAPSSGGSSNKAVRFENEVLYSDQTKKRLHHEKKFVRGSARKEFSAIETKFDCFFCSESFASDSSLELHIKEFHKIKKFDAKFAQNLDWLNFGSPSASASNLEQEQDNSENSLETENSMEVEANRYFLNLSDISTDDFYSYDEVETSTDVANLMEVLQENEGTKTNLPPTPYSKSSNKGPNNIKLNKNVRPSSSIEKKKGNAQGKNRKQKKAKNADLEISKCKLCRKVFANSDYLEEHIAAHHDKKTNAVCSECKHAYFKYRDADPMSTKCRGCLTKKEKKDEVLLLSAKKQQMTPKKAASSEMQENIKVNSPVENETGTPVVAHAHSSKSNMGGGAGLVRKLDFTTTEDQEEDEVVAESETPSSDDDDIFDPFSNFVKNYDSPSPQSDVDEILETPPTTPLGSFFSGVFRTLSARLFSSGSPKKVPKSIFNNTGAQESRSDKKLKVDLNKAFIVEESVNVTIVNDKRACNTKDKKS